MKALLTGLLDWTDARFPVSKMWNEHIGQYYAPKNFNFWYFFGSLALLVLVLQFVSGIWLAMYYKPSAEEAFSSVEFIMREVAVGVVHSLPAFDRRVVLLRDRLFCICTEVSCMARTRAHVS